MTFANRLTVILTVTVLASVPVACLAGERPGESLRGGSAEGGQPPIGSCGDPATPIHAIQGSGLASPEVGNVHTIEGVVVGDFQPGDRLAGYFVQEEDGDQDGDPVTSEGIFVYHGSVATVDVDAGDLVRVRGTITEFFDLTQLTLTEAVVCGTATPTAAPLALPLPSAQTDLERVEGMLVSIGQQLAVTDSFNLGRFGEVGLAFDPAEPFQFTPTERVEPGSAQYQQLAALNQRSRVLVDDGSTAQNLTWVPYVHAVAPATLRRGDTAAAVFGVISEGFQSYRLQPVGAPGFSRLNERPASPDPSVAAGADVVVGTFNLLNYFTTIDDGFNEARGADSAAELARQEAKLVAALCGLGADIIAVQELENNGDAGASSAAASLAAALGASCSGSWTFIDTGMTGANPGGVSPDAITVGILYDADAVAPAGATALLETGVFDGLSRPPVAQAFLHPSTGETFVVVVNHFKSKSCGGAVGADLDQGDGQGCFNATRIASAQQLLSWLASDPTGTGEPDVLVLGDLNSYTREDPIDALVAGGFVNLVEAHVEPSRRYSFVNFGEAGLLDHALASPSLAARVTGVGVWHINADEPRALDYNDNVADSSTTPDVLNNDPSLYAPDAYRSADHDPVVVGLALSGGVFADGFESGDASAWSAAVP